MPARLQCLDKCLRIIRDTIPFGAIVAHISRVFGYYISLCLSLVGADSGERDNGAQDNVAEAILHCGFGIIFAGEVSHFCDKGVMPRKLRRVLDLALRRSFSNQQLVTFPPYLNSVWELKIPVCTAHPFRPECATANENCPQADSAPMDLYEQHRAIQSRVAEAA
jgi:hypothetical protein